MIFYHGTTLAKGQKIMQTELRARFYESQWFTLATEEDGIELAYHHAKSRNAGKSPCVIKISLPKNKVKEYVYREGGMKKPIPSKYCKILTSKELKSWI